MENTSYVALSRQSALRRQLDVVANNLANMSTHGYKGGRMMFVDHLVKSKGGDNLLTPKLSFVREYRDHDRHHRRSDGNNRQSA